MRLGIGLLAAGLIGHLAMGGWPVEVATGQGPETIDPRLSRAMDRSVAGERIPVLIEIERIAGPDPLSPSRELRASEHASDLASRYDGARRELERDLSPATRADLSTGPLIWAGGAVAVELTREQVRALAGEPAVQRLYYDGLIQVDLAGSDGAPPPALGAGPRAIQDPGGGLPAGLQRIGAPTLWAAGATGEGTVVAIIDSGVDGDHPLLSHNWRGLSAPAAEAWYDPWGLTAVPVDDDNTGGVGHGTIVATIAVGSLQPGDTFLTLNGPQPVQDELDVVTGVAPGASWIAANAFEDFGGASYTRLSVLLQAMQWALDPDGDPAIVSDVPAVVNNSWGFQSDGCDNVFDRAIDALELVGIPVVFAAGNRSAGLDTIASPAQRADLLLNAFAVGAVEVRGGEVLVAPNSLGGPSPCSPGSVKPEVVAPGQVPVVARRSDDVAELRGGTGAFTSWAAPHASGGLALLRGLDSQAGGDDLKQALFTTATDLPPAGLDNQSGAGLIDLPAAAERLGGLGGVRLTLADWIWTPQERSLELRLRNRGVVGFAGGSAELRRAGVAEALRRTDAPALAPGASGTVTFRDLPADLSGGHRLRVRFESFGGELAFALRLAGAPVSSVTLTDGPARFSLDGKGRIGRVSGPVGFELGGTDWLTGGGVLVGRGDRVSDGVYVDVLQQPSLKPDPVGSDTDWRSLQSTEEGGRAIFRYTDDRALEPMGATVDQVAEIVALGDSAAYALLSVTVEIGTRGGPVLAGLLLDWDFPPGDSVFWDEGIGASVMTARGGAGPWMALTTAPMPPTTHSEVPLGTAEQGFYVAGKDAGVLAQLDGFRDEEKSRFLRLGAVRPTRSDVSDWSQLVSVGPLGSEETVDFLIAAALTREAMGAALDAVRAAAAARRGAEPAVVARTLELLPPFPNPFDPSEGQAIRLPYLVTRGEESIEARLRVFTISGRRVFEERRELGPASTVEPFSWDGRLEGGELAASGVYGYILEAGGQKRMGKFLLLK